MQTFKKIIDMFAKHVHVLVLHSNELFAQEFTVVFPCRPLLGEDFFAQERREDVMVIPEAIVYID